MLDSFPPQGGIILDKGWKFHAGDNSAWAQPDVDDSYWQPINPLQPITQIEQAKIGWLRLHITLGKKLQGQTVSAGFGQIFACEIYFKREACIPGGKGKC